MTEQDLSAAFGPSAAAQARTTKLGSILPKRSEQSDRPPQQASQPAGPVDDQDASGNATGEAMDTASDQEEHRSEDRASERAATGNAGGGRTKTSTDQQKPDSSSSDGERIGSADTATTSSDQRKQSIAGLQSTTTVPVSVYIRPDVLAIARRRIRGRQRMAHAEIAIEAIEAQHFQLAELVAARHTTQVRPGSGLFPARHVLRRGGDGPRRVLWTIFLTGAEIAVIDQLCEEHHAQSRSELISAAVEAHLTPRSRRR